MDNILIIGGSSDIAKSILSELHSQNNNLNFIVVSSQKDNFKLNIISNNIQTIYSDYSEQAIEKVCLELKEKKLCFSYVFIFNGVLSGEGFSPEKKIEDLNTYSLQETFRVNAVVPALWIKHLQSVLKNKTRCVLVVFSARLASISDNKLGGWYSYRSSKAALNMLVKTASIEYQRRAKNVDFILFHPGTVDTKLSKAFTKNKLSHEVFSPQLAAKNLLEVLAASSGEKYIEYLDWQGKAINW